MATSGAFSDYTENAIAKAIFRNTTMFTPPTSVYVALFTTMPADDGTGGVEVSGTSYVREGVTTGTSGTGSGSGWDAPSGGNGIVANNVDILFPVAGGSWGTVLGIGLYDASTSGNLLVYCTFDSSVVISTNDQLKIPSGNLTITIS